MNGGTSFITSSVLKAKTVSSRSSRCSHTTAEYICTRGSSRGCNSTDTQNRVTSVVVVCSMYSTYGLFLSLFCLFNFVLASSKALPNSQLLERCNRIREYTFFQNSHLKLSPPRYNPIYSQIIRIISCYVYYLPPFKSVVFTVGARPHRISKPVLNKQRVRSPLLCTWPTDQREHTELRVAHVQFTVGSSSFGDADVYAHD